MAKDWTTELISVLIDRSRVSLPGIGTFELTEAAAVVDQIGGRVQAPGSRVTFNENLVLDDGYLVQHLRDQHQMSADAAQSSVQHYAQNILDRINDGQQVNLAGLGMLRKNFEDKIKFTPSGKNLSKVHFGLPEVQVESIIRRPAEQALPPKTAAAPTLKPTLNPTITPKPLPTQKSDTQERRKQLILWLAAATLLLLLAGFLIDRTFSDSSEPSPRSRAANDVPATRAEAPTDDAFTRIPDGSPRTDDQDRNDSSYQPDPATVGTSDDSDTRNPEPPPADRFATVGKNAVIAVGQFGNQSNVDRAVRRVRNAGYEVYTRRADGLTRVGASVVYESEAELDSKLRQVRRDLGVSDAFILIKDGRNLLDE
ncbi:MAG: SPOR domain-containing protein [Bacteroidota bacterium]